MTDEDGRAADEVGARRGRLSSVGGTGGGATDPRVAAVLEVLAGRPVAEVARQRAVDAAVLHRWVRAFVEAGTARVTNTPEADLARQRDRFLAAFAHELRTPLAVARGWGEMLLEDDLPPAMVSTTVQRLHDALGRLAERVLDVELLAAASLGRLRLSLRPVTVGTLAAGVVDAARVAGADVEVTVDPDLFPRVLRDLWLAASTTPAPRSLGLTVTTEGPWVELRVERVGDPIDSQHLQALFDPFDLNDDATGITIGLYLARALTVAHAGTLGVEQDDESAAFWVRVPRERPAIDGAPPGSPDKE